MRSLIATLWPREAKGFLTELKERFTFLQDHVTISIRILGEQNPCLPQTLTKALLGVSDEAIHNALRHSAATEITLCFAVSGHEVYLEIRDNGQGFALTTAKKGYGLQSMAERMQAVLGKLRVESQVGGGTIIKAYAEMNEEGDNDGKIKGGDRR